MNNNISNGSSSEIIFTIINLIKEDGGCEKKETASKVLKKLERGESKENLEHIDFFLFILKEGKFIEELDEYFRLTSKGADFNWDKFAGRRLHCPLG